MGKLVAAVGMAAALGATPAPAQSRSEDRAVLQAEYDRDVAALRTEHAKTLAEIRAETMLLEEKVALLHRMVPPEFEAALAETRLQGLAAASEMKPVVVQRVPGSEPVQLADGGATPYARAFLDVSGQDRYIAVGFFLDRIGRLPLVVELHTLSLEAAPDGDVRFTARLGFPYFTGWPDAPAAPPPAPRVRASQGAPADARSAFREALFEQRAFLQGVTDAARGPIRRLQAQIFAVHEMKRQRAPARFYAALERLEPGVNGKMVALGRAQFGPRTVIQGAVVGAHARAALRPAFEKAGFVVEALDVAAGGCPAFSLTARLQLPEDDGGAPDVQVGPSPFRPATELACNAPPEPARGSVSARGTSGDVTARLRDVDLTDVFHLLATLGHGSFVVDAAVMGRVNVDFERATLDEALAALGAAGVSVGPGPLRRVSLAGTRQPPLPRAASREPGVSLYFKNGVLLDVLRLFEEISGRKAWTAPQVSGRVTIFAAEVPWDVALEGIAASVGMTARIEDERLFVGPAAMAQAPWTSGAVEATRATTTDGDPYWGKVVEVFKLGPEDLTPVGFVRSTQGVKGVFYGPGRLLWTLEPGVELFDSRVDAVDVEGATFATPDGRKVALRFAP
jgi:hypothetical protein